MRVKHIMISPSLTMLLNYSGANPWEIEVQSDSRTNCGLAC